MYRRNRQSASNRGKYTWHCHHQQYDIGRTRWWNNTKSRQEAVSTTTTQTIRHSRWRPSDVGPAYSGKCISSMVDLTRIGSPKWHGASTKTCYEHHIPKHSLYRSISECTADFSGTETCAVMWTFLHTNRRSAAQTAYTSTKTNDYNTQYTMPYSIFFAQGPRIVSLTGACSTKITHIDS